MCWPTDSRKALEARRRNRFRSALSAILRRSRHDPMHRWVTGRRCAGRQGGFAVWAAASLAPQLTWRRVAPRPCRGLPGQAELYRPGPTPVYFWRSAREWASSCSLLPPGQPVNSQVSLSEVWLGRRPQASEVREWWARRGALPRKNPHLASSTAPPGPQGPPRPLRPPDRSWGPENLTLAAQTGLWRRW